MLGMSWSVVGVTFPALACPAPKTALPARTAVTRSAPAVARRPRGSPRRSAANERGLLVSSGVGIGGLQVVRNRPRGRVAAGGPSGVVQGEANRDADAALRAE